MMNLKRKSSALYHNLVETLTQDKVDDIINIAKNNALPMYTKGGGMYTLEYNDDDMSAIVYKAYSNAINLSKLHPNIMADMQFAKELCDNYNRGFIVSQDDTKMQNSTAQTLHNAVQNLPYYQYDSNNAMPKYAKPAKTVTTEQSAPVATFKRPNPSITAEQFVSKVPCRIYHDNVYVQLDGAYYQDMNKTRFYRLLNTYFRSEAERYGSARFYDEVLNFVQCDQRFVIEDVDVQKISQYICLKDGYLDMFSMQYFAPNPNIFFTKFINLSKADVVGASASPVFDSFSYFITGGDPILQLRILQMIGYILSNDNKAKSIFVLQGVTNSGKSTLISLITSFCVDELVAAVNVLDMANNFSIAELADKFINIDAELPSNALKPASVRRLKELSSGDLLSSDVKYKGRVTFRCFAKLLFATNHPVILESKDDAFMQRLICIPFAYEVPRSNWDSTLLDRLKAERPAILKKAIKAYLQLLQSHYAFAGDYPINDLVETSSKKYVDPLKEFLDKALTEKIGSYLFVNDIREKFQQWLDNRQLDNPYKTDMAFGKALRFYLPQKIFSKKRRYPGQNPQSVIMDTEYVFKS